MARIETKVKSVLHKGITYDAVVDFTKIDENGVMKKTFPIKVFLDLKENTIGWKCEIGGEVFGDFKKLNLK